MNEDEKQLLPVSVSGIVRDQRGNPVVLLKHDNGDEVLPIANALQPHFHLVVASQDWHPPNHGSFAENHASRNPGEVVELEGLPQVLWPRGPGVSWEQAW